MFTLESRESNCSMRRSTSFLLQYHAALIENKYNILLFLELTFPSRVIALSNMCMLS